MDGSYHLTSFYQEEYRPSSCEEDVSPALGSYGSENSYRVAEHNQQCCSNSTPHHLLHSREDHLHPKFQHHLQPLNPNIPPRPSPSPITHNNISMERTPSGHSILSVPLTPLTVSTACKDKHTITDHSAATSMITSFRHRRRHTLEERVLHSLLHTSTPLDNEALHSLLLASDKVFFNNHLAGRVRWEWSHPSSPRYSHSLIGTTALRKAQGREGYETLIVLSRPMLWSGRYDRRLVLSTFLHEAVHCYLFVRCGFGALREGGHTWGFRAIARVIDAWSGGRLQLRNTTADLASFSLAEEPHSDLNPFSIASEQHPDSNSPNSTQPSLESSTKGKSSSDIQSSEDRPPVLRQRLPRIDRARYRRVAEMSYSQSLSPDSDGGGTPRQGWSTFVAFAGGDVSVPIPR